MSSLKWLYIWRPWPHAGWCTQIFLIVGSKVRYVEIHIGCSTWSAVRHFPALGSSLHGLSIHTVDFWICGWRIIQVAILLDITPSNNSDVISLLKVSGIQMYRREIQTLHRRIWQKRAVQNLYTDNSSNSILWINLIAFAERGLIEHWKGLGNLSWFRAQPKVQLYDEQILTKRFLIASSHKQV